MKQVSIIALVLPDGKLVVQRRAKDAFSSAGLLGFFGGHIETGESPLDAMTRELAEETSLDVDSLTITKVTEVELPNSTDPTQKKKFYFYTTNIPSDDFDVFEGDGAETYSLDELNVRTDVAVSARHMIEHYLP